MSLCGSNCKTINSVMNDFVSAMNEHEDQLGIQSRKIYTRKECVAQLRIRAHLFNIVSLNINSCGGGC